MIFQLLDPHLVELNLHQNYGKISIKKNKDKIILKFTSKSFLQQQVRSMVGCIKYLGEGKWNINDFKKSFKSKKRLKCAPPAPACGLYLQKLIIKINYSNKDFI